MSEGSGSGSGRQYRPLLPAEPEGDYLASSSSVPDLGKRTQTKTACRECQRKKTKCTGERPTCVRCRRNNKPCNYDAELDTTRYFTLKKRHDEMQREHGELLALFQFLRARPEDEAQQILTRIRTSNESFSKIYETITQADLLLGSSATAAALPRQEDDSSRSQSRGNEGSSTGNTSSRDDSRGDISMAGAG